MRALQNKPLRRRKLDIHFSIPKVLPTITFYYFVKPHGMIIFISQKHHQKYLLG
jgi:hypothetical protein